MWAHIYIIIYKYNVLIPGRTSGHWIPGNYEPNDIYTIRKFLELDQDPTKIAGISVDILWTWYIWMYLIGFCGAPVSFSRFFLCFSMFFLCSYNEMWVVHPVSSIFRAPKTAATWVTVPESSKSARRSSAPQPDMARSGPWFTRSLGIPIW